MSNIRCAVIGVGYLGRFHAQKYKLLQEAELVAVCDVNEAQAKAVATELDTEAFTDYRVLFGKVDAVSIAASTQQHFTIAQDCLAAGLHVLIEKPITETVAQAETLISLAKKNQCLLQVGHLERFNAAVLAVAPYLETPVFIESERLAPFNPRGSDVNVVLDLMIHDIDIIQHLVQSPILHIEAQGTPVLTPAIDIANARITFANQCVAHVTASRISFKRERKTRIFQKDTYLSIDYQNKQFAVYKKGEGELFPGIADIISEEKTFAESDALLEEIKAFLQAILTKTQPLVTGEEGRDALATAQRITSLITQNLSQHHVAH
jgi:predicted dehydrogenase